MLQDRHPDNDLGSRSDSAAAATLRPALLEGLGDDLKHGVVLEQRVDLAPLMKNHARAVSYGRSIAAIERLITAGRQPSVLFSYFRGHFFTAK